MWHYNYYACDFNKRPIEVMQPLNVWLMIGYWTGALLIESYSRPSVYSFAFHCVLYWYLCMC